MRIAILGSHGIPARYGGFETFAEQLAVRLVERGHKVTVFCEKAERARKRYKGVELRHIPAYRLGPLSTIFYDAACLWQARFSFDVVYMLGYGSSALCWLPRLWGAQTSRKMPPPRPDFGSPVCWVRNGRAVLADLVPTG